MFKVPSGLQSIVSQNMGGGSDINIFPARVVHPILENLTEPKVFKDYGDWGSLGGVFFNQIANPNLNPDFTTNRFARPLFPNVVSVPLKNEIMYCTTQV